jgi:hypothetical protein
MIGSISGDDLLRGLVRAVRSNSLSDVEMIIWRANLYEQLDQLHFNGNEALRVAAHSGHVEILKELLTVPKIKAFAYALENAALHNAQKRLAESKSDNNPEAAKKYQEIIDILLKIDVVKEWEKRLSRAPSSKQRP